MEGEASAVLGLCADGWGFGWLGGKWLTKDHDSSITEDAD